MSLLPASHLPFSSPPARSEKRGLKGDRSICYMDLSLWPPPKTRSIDLIWQARCNFWHSNIIFQKNLAHVPAQVYNS